MEKDKSVLLILVIVYVLTSIYYSFVVVRSSLDSNKKLINIILVWIIPILWGIMIKTMFKPIKEKDKKTDKSNYYESGIGISGY